MVFSFLGGKGGDSRRKPEVKPRFPSMAQVRAYWEGQRGTTGAIPARADLDPRGLAQALDHVFVAERIGTGLLRMRISGMGLTDLAGLDMKGLPISTLFLPEARLQLAQAVERVFTLPGVAELHLEAERSIGRPALEARLLLLPLRSNGGGLDLVLGCLAAEGQIGRTPRRFGILRSIEERLVMPAEVLAPAEPARPAQTQTQTPNQTQAQSQPAFAEPPVPPLRPLRGHPHLRLVHSAD
ncbi:PAS domain-containing protein [Rhodobacter sp. Har01]|uniref:PAS domain-containing protein n=1 Tax=Rhodobacter sp. Har01 TaxID=2883999 RepID=UPI001D08D039|nr:PAS domain-containing protein [Rhodobacter sp. Har01]MCB6176997.1 PAS domain-containing protein [Rhodobacter sp. Har01]